MMIISLLIYTQIIYAVAEVYNESLFDESKQNSSRHIWHSYTFNTGTGNREELYLAKIGFNSNFDSINGVFIWKSLQVQEEIVLIGLANNFLIITTLNKENNSLTFKEEIQNSANALAVFQKWNAKTQGIESFIIVATQASQENYILKWYQILNRKLKFLWDWPFYNKITYLDIIKINSESRLLIVNNNSKIQKTSSAEIYSFNINYDLNIWLFEKIILDAIPSSITVFDNTDNVFLCASFPSLEMIHIFKYSKSLCKDSLEEKYFASHQKIFMIGLKSLISFQVSYRWYLAIASKISSIYYIGQNLLFQPVNTLNLSSFNNWLAIPVDTYREDIILLADSNSGVSVIIWTGNEHLETLGSFTDLACKDDAYCLKKMDKIAMNESTIFGQNGIQNIIISTKNGSPLLFKLHVKLKPLPDRVTLKLKSILDLKTSLEKNYTNQNQKINELLTQKEGNMKKESKELSRITFEANQVPETISQAKNWSEIKYDVDQLKLTIEALNGDVKKFLIYLKSNTSLQVEQNPKIFLTKNVTHGITFYGDVLIRELNLSNLNGYNVNKLLRDSFRKNKINKICGKKILKNLKAENVIFEKIKDVMACDVVFSDELVEEKSRNIINGDVLWQNNLNILNNVMIIPQITKRNTSLGKISRETPKHIYDSLNLEELKVTEDTYVQRTINGQPFILPVHGGQLNILDIVNQARVEVVNVKQNLNIGFINGKNFSHFLQNLLFKLPPQNQFETMKIDGAFSAPVLQTNHLNNIDLSEGTPNIANHKFSYKLLARIPNTYVKEKNFKKAEQQNLKRTIHVFQNLEVDGILFSNRINNISWMVLNDTIRKDEETVPLTGTKKFEKLLTVKNVTLSGTLNGRFVDHILTNFSHQIIRFRQIFDNVKFKNLSLEGAWDDVLINQLNNSIVRLLPNNGQTSNVTFIDECFVNILKVTNFVNNINLKDKKIVNKTNNKTELKSIKAGNVVLHGSLMTNNKINNMNFSNFSLLRVSLKSPETIEQNLFHHNVSISGELNVQTLNLNDFSSVVNSGGDTNLIEKFLNGEIYRIKKLLVKGNITTSQGVNGVNVSRIVEKGVCITKPNSLKGNITFENIIYFDNINVTNSIDGFLLKKLEKDIVFRHSHVFLNGPKNFSTVKVNKNMKGRSLNGHLVEEIVTLKGDQTMKGPIEINGDVIVKGNLTTYAAINNINVPDLLKTYSTRVNFFIFSGDLNLQSDQITIENLIVDGNIQNISLGALIDDAVLKEDSFNISGKKLFTGEVKLKGSVLVEDFIYGVNFSKFYSDVVYINKPTKFEETITIRESVLKVLETTGYFNSSLINNFDTNDWLEDSIPLDKYEVVYGKKIFEKVYALQDVSVDFMNGHLTSAMISLKKKQYIPSLALFSRIHTISDLSVSGFVNGWNLKKEYQDTLLLRGRQTVNGKTLFNQEFVVKGTLFVDTIKGKSVNSLITLNTEQIITTPLEFKALVMAKKNVENLKIINNISLHDWNKNSLLLNQDQVVNGLWTVKGRVKTKNIDGNGLLHAVSLPDVFKEIQKSRLMALEMKNATKTEYSDQCHKLEELSEEFSKLPYLFYQFEVADEIETSSVIDSVITFKINNEHHLIITFLNQCLSTFYKWNTNHSTFDYLRQINIGPVDKWSIIYHNNATYLVTTSLRSSIICEENLQQGNVWIFKNDSDKYTHLLSTNAFVDITCENNTSDEFFTIDKNGILQQWALEENGNISSKFLLNLGQGNYRFVDFRIMGGLAISNGREIKQIIHTENKVIENNIFLTNAHIVALPIDSKTLIAVVLKDKIVIYENILEDKIFSVIHTYRAGSVLWFSYGTEKQAFLIIASHHKLIEVYEYKSVAGLVRKMSIQIFSSRLQSETLPVKEKYQSDKFLIIIQKKKLIFIKADMLGDFFKKPDSFC